MNLKQKLLVLSMASLSTSVLAGPQSFINARAFGMAGTGVAAANSSGASFMNPALLAIHQRDEADDLAVVLPSLNGRFADDEDVIDQVDDVQDTINNLNTAVNALDVPGAQAAAGVLRDQLVKLNRDTARADLGAGVAVAIPNELVALGVFADASFRATARGDISDADLAFLNDVATGAIAPDTINKDGATGGQTLTSTGSVVAAAFAEIGVSVAVPFQFMGNQMAIGVSPKVVQLRTFDFTQNVSDFDEEDFDDSDFEDDDTGFSADLGLAYQMLNNSLVIGLQIRNIIPLDMKSVAGRKFELDPRATVGIAHSSEWHTLTVDLDLTETDPFGFDDKTQWLAVGGEADLLDFLQVRVGARKNLADNNNSQGIEEDVQYTAGFGFSPLGIHIEAAGMVSDADVGGAIELAVAF